MTGLLTFATLPPMRHYLLLLLAMILLTGLGEPRPASAARRAATHAKTGSKSGAPTKKSRGKGPVVPAKGTRAAKGSSSGKKGGGGVGKAANAKSRGAKGKRDQQSDGPPPADKPLTAKEKRKAARERAALAKTCAGAKAKYKLACKRFRAAEDERQEAEKAAALERKCSVKKNKKLAECKALVARGSRPTGDPCGRKYGRARKKESLARFARRYGTTESAVRHMNGLGDGKVRLKTGKRYLVAKSPHDGVVLAGGVQMPLNGETFRLRRPNNAWGKTLLVDALQAASVAVQASSPLGHTVLFGDLSKEGGGCLPPHKSHRGGLDVDIGYYLRGGSEPKYLIDATVETLDADRSWQFLRALLASGRIQYAFVHYKLQPALYEAGLRAGETPETLHRLIQYPRPMENWLETPIRHLKGHDDHSHVRLTCADEACVLDDEAKARILATRMENLGGPMSEGRLRGGRPRGPLLQPMR